MTEYERASLVLLERLVAAVDELRSEIRVQGEGTRRAVQCVENQFELARREAIDDLMDLEEAARHLHMSPKTLQNKTSMGLVPSVKIEGMGRRWSRRDLTALARKNGAGKRQDGAAAAQPLLRAL